MLRFTDDLSAVSKAYQNGEVAAEELWMHVTPRLERAAERETLRILNLLDVAVYSLCEAARTERIVEILNEAAGLVSSGAR